MNIFKIVFIINNLNAGGAERTVVSLSNYLSRCGHDVCIIIYGSKGFYTIDKSVQVIQIIDEYNFKNSFVKELYGYFDKRNKISKILYKKRPDFVFCMLYPSIIYLFGKKKFGFKLIASERSNPAYLKSKLKRFIKLLCFKYADEVIFQTERAKDYYSKKLKNKGVVIPNSIGNDIAKSLIIDYSLRIKKISAIGTLKKEKDYFTLIKAFKIVNEKYNDYKLEIYGDGYLLDELRRLTIDLNIQNSVLFMGSCPNALLKISDATCYVLSSISEGMPNTLLEAMAIGLPSISTNCNNGPSELINNGVNGLLVPVGDYIALSNAIFKFIENPEFAQKCGNLAINFKKKYSIENITNDILNRCIYLKYGIK